jgi:Uma2 family endonuclease
MPTLTAANDPALTFHLDGIVDLDDDKVLFELCQRNKDLRIERLATGGILLMSPAGGKTSVRNAQIVKQLGFWADQDGSGHVFDSSGGFTLPNGAMRSPDAAWVERERLQALTEEQQERFLPLCPTFVIELRSPSDTLVSVETKMSEYIGNGARLGWLVDPARRCVHVYRPGAVVEVLREPSTVAGDPELPDFVLDLTSIWKPW